MESYIKIIFKDRKRAETCICALEAKLISNRLFALRVDWHFLCSDSRIIHELIGVLTLILFAK